MLDEVTEGRMTETAWAIDAKGGAPSGGFKWLNRSCVALLNEF
jgi:hypothetical protein